MLALFASADAAVIIAALIVALASVLSLRNASSTNKQVKETNGWAEHLAKGQEYILATLHDMNTQAHEMEGWARNHDERHDIETRDD